MPVISRIQLLMFQKWNFTEIIRQHIPCTHKDCIPCNVCTYVQDWTQLVAGLAKLNKIRNFRIKLWKDFPYYLLYLFKDFLNGVANCRKFCSFRNCFQSWTSLNVCNSFKMTEKNYANWTILKQHGKLKPERWLIKIIAH